MSRATKRRMQEALVECHGRTFTEQLRIDVATGTPSPLFRLLVASILLSARIGHGLALDAARPLSAEGWTTPRKLSGTTWEQRVRVLNAGVGEQAASGASCGR